MVALGRLDAHRLRDRDVHRRARGRRRQGSARVPPRAAREASAPPRGARLAAQKAGWGKPLAPAKAPAQRGARHRRARVVQHLRRAGRRSDGDADGKFTVDRVVCAVDCGIAVNPDVVRAQMEGGIGFGLSAALYGAITLKDGVVEQSNFHDYPLLRIDEMPAVEVHIVASTEQADRRRRARRAADRARGGERALRGHRKRLRSLPLSLA